MIELTEREAIETVCFAAETEAIASWENERESDALDIYTAIKHLMPKFKFTFPEIFGWRP